MATGSAGGSSRAAHEHAPAHARQEVGVQHTTSSLVTAWHFNARFCLQDFREEGFRAPLCGVVAVAVRLRLAARRCRPRRSAPSSIASAVVAAVPGVPGASMSAARRGVFPRIMPLTLGVTAHDCTQGAAVNPQALVQCRCSN